MEVFVFGLAVIYWVGFGLCCITGIFVNEVYGVAKPLIKSFLWPVWLVIFLLKY